MSDCPEQHCDGSGLIGNKKCGCVMSGERKKLFDQRYDKEYLRIRREVTGLPDPE